MKDAPRLLIVMHSHSGGARILAQAAAAHAGESAPKVQIDVFEAPDVHPEHLRAAQALLIVSPENFGYMAGLVKDFFDRCFYPCETAMAGKPYALIVCAGNDGTGAMNAMERLITGWRMRRAHAGLIARRVGGEAGSAKGELSPNDIETAREIGGTLAALIDHD